MTQNNYNGINNRYQYIQDALKSTQEQKKGMQAQQEFDLSSKYAADDIDADSNQKFADSFGDEGHAGVFKAIMSGYASGQQQGTAKKKDQERNKMKEARQYLEDQDRELREEVKQMRVEEYGKEKMKPYISAFIKGAGRLSPMAQMAQGNALTEKMNALGILGGEKKLVGQDSMNPAIWNMQDVASGEEMRVDMGMLVAGSALTEDELASVQTSHIEKIDRESKEKEQKHLIDKGKLLNDQNKTAYDQNPANTFLKKHQETLGTKFVEYRQTALNKKQVINILDNMERIADENKEWLYTKKGRMIAQWITPDYEAGTAHFKEELAREELEKGPDAEKRLNAIKELNKNYGNLLFYRIQAQKGNRLTDAIMNMDAKSLPIPWNMGYDSYKEMNTMLRNNTINEKHLLDQEINQGMEQLAGAGYTYSNVGGQETVQESSNEGAQQQNGNNWNRSLGLDKMQQSGGGNGTQLFNVQLSSGKIAGVPIEGLEEVINEGGKLIL